MTKRADIITGLNIERQHLAAYIVDRLQDIETEGGNPEHLAVALAGYGLELTEVLCGTKAALEGGHLLLKRMRAQRGVGVVAGHA